MQGWLVLRGIAQLSILGVKCLSPQALSQSRIAITPPFQLCEARKNNELLYFNSMRKKSSDTAAVEMVGWTMDPCMVYHFFGGGTQSSIKISIAATHSSVHPSYCDRGLQTHGPPAQMEAKHCTESATEWGKEEGQ